MHLPSTRVDWVDDDVTPDWSLTLSDSLQVISKAMLRHLASQA
jgi:hypothetical protein